MTCDQDGCEDPTYARGRCKRCYARWYRQGYERPWTPPCAVTGCSEHSLARGLCNRHYQRARDHGHPEATSLVEADATRALLSWLRSQGASDRWLGARLDKHRAYVWSVRSGEKRRVHRAFAAEVDALARRVGRGDQAVPGQADARRRQIDRERKRVSRASESPRP